MADTFKIKQRDTKPYLELTLGRVTVVGDEDVFTPDDLTGLTLQHIVRLKASGTVNAPHTNRALKASEKVDVATGKVDFRPGRDEVKLVGIHQLEVEATDPTTGEVQTYPTEGYFEFEVVDDVGDAAT